MKAVDMRELRQKIKGKYHLPDQEEKIKEYAKRKNWEIIKIFSEKETGVRYIGLSSRKCWKMPRRGDLKKSFC